MSEARGRRPGLLVLARDAWNLVLLAARSLQPVLVLAMLALVAWAMLSRQPWPFSIEAESEHVSLALSPDLETHWRIDGALLCVRAGAAGPDLVPLEGPSPCPGRRWQAFDLRGLDEVALLLPASAHAEAGYTARLDVEPDGGLAMQLSGDGDALEPLGLLPGGAARPLPLGRDLILRFPPPGAGAPLGRVLLPFSGAGTIGKDVSWREPTLLRGGSVSLYTRSDEAAGGRDLVAGTELVAGDRVDFGPQAERPAVVTKGFVHFDLLPEVAEPPAMRVVVFGEAESVRIVRFGEQGYSFAPGAFARLTRHSAVSTWAVLCLSMLGLMAMYREGSDIGEGTLLERRRQFAANWRAFWSAGRDDDD